MRPWVSHQMFFPVAKNASCCFKLFIKTGVTHNIIYLWEFPKFCLFWGFLGLIHEIQTLVMNFLRRQRFHTICICISNHSHLILSKKSNSFMWKLCLHLKLWLKRTKNNQFSTTSEDNFNLKPWVSHQMFFPVAKNASLCFKLFIKNGVTHNIINLWVVPKFCLF